MNDHQTPWLAELATTQNGAPPNEGRYDAKEQLTIEPSGRRAIEGAGDRPTKKADRETGEDQKAHW